MFSLILEFFCSPKSYLFLCLKKMQTSESLNIKFFVG